MLHKVSEDGDDSVDALSMDREEQSELQLGSRAPNNSTNTSVPSSDIHIRNRLLSKMGTKVDMKCMIIYYSSIFKMSMVHQSMCLSIVHT